MVKRGPVHQMPDLVIEVKSPDDTYTSMRERAQYYLAHGAKVVWLLYPEKRLVEVYRQDADSELLTGDDTLNGGDVLPHFVLSVHEIFDLDSIYANDNSIPQATREPLHFHFYITDRDTLR